MLNQAIRSGTRSQLNLATVRSEPFRLFFPLGVLVGMIGVAVWPLYFGGVLANYPGPGHTRMMGQGFFGAFIFGFLGTALPRMLSVKSFPLPMFALIGLSFGVFVVANVLGTTWLADAAFLVALILFFGNAIVRIAQRQDVPPPGFVLVALAFACAIAGTTIGLLERWVELDLRLLTLRPLLAYQGFVLLPVLGVGAFILPKLFGLRNQHDFPETRHPPRSWKAKALFALAVGFSIVGTFWLEVSGWYRTAHGIRFLVAAIYLGRELPVWKSGLGGSAIVWSLRVGIVMILVGLISVAVLPEYRVGLLHILLVGGLGLITIIVATRVVFGHSGNGPLLFGPNKWMWWVSGWILVGMATRISGDFLPHIMVSHYNYGVLCWIIGMGIWAWKVLPNVLIPDDD